MGVNVFTAFCVFGFAGRRAAVLGELRDFSNLAASRTSKARDVHAASAVRPQHALPAVVPHAEHGPERLDAERPGRCIGGHSHSGEYRQGVPEEAAEHWDL